MKKRLLSIICVLSIILSMVVIPQTVSATDSTTLSPASTQQRRMWCQTNYNSKDYVYEPWSLTHWGRILYLRFASNTVVGSQIKKATIKLDARARETEKTVFLAALNISDSSASIVESNLASLTSTNKVKVTNTADKLMLDTSGYYLPAVASSVVAYTKATASDTTTTEDIYTNSSGSLLFNHPMEIELDVTDSVKSALTSGNHVQFVLSSTKDVLTSDGENLYDIENFGSFSNGVIYDENGNVIKNTDSRLNLDRSIPVCGNSGFYSSSDIDDPYFSWLHIVRDSISLEIEYAGVEDVFKEFAASIKDGRDFEKNIDSISTLLDSDAYELYNKIRVDGKLNDELYTLAKSSASLEVFNQGFITIVNDFYLQEQGVTLSVKTDLGGRRGKISTDNPSALPYAAFGQIKAYDESDSLIKTYTVNVKNGEGYYNVYGKENIIKKLEITLTSDKEGTTPLSSTRTLYIEDLNLPPVFISEITARQEKTHYPDTTTQNTGSYVQDYQFIELYNYSDTPVDLSEYSFVYNVNKEHKFDFIWESGSDKILSPGELFIVGVYSADSATSGHKYDTDSDKADYWEAFNAFYDVDIPITSRAMIACVKSGDGATTLDGLSKLMRSYDAGKSISAEIRKGDEIITKINLSDDNMASSGYSFQFTPGWGDTKEENILFCSGNYPYELMQEQKIDFCEKVYYNSTNKQRVMSYNILATNDAGRTVASRYPLFVKTIKDFDIDIFGMQEVNYLWISLLKGSDLSGYGCVEGYSTYGKTYSNITTNIWDLMNPIYYKKDRYTLIEGGGEFLTPDGNMSTKQWDCVNMKRTLTYAVLKDNETGKVTSFINTHLVLSGKQARVEQVKLLYKKGEELKKKYGGGIVIVGDHNFFEGAEPYHTYESSGVVTDAKYRTTNHISNATTPTFNKNSTVYGSPIDLCFISPDDYIVEKYDVFHGVYPEGTVSDHSAVYVDLLDRDSIYEDYNLTDENVRFIGRNDINNYGGALNWPGTGFEFKFKGSSADVYVSHLTKAAYFNVIIDNGTPKRIQLATGWNSIAKDLTDAEHTVKFIRSSEAVDGRAYFGDLRIIGEAPSPTLAPTRKIEFYGDSFTVGYGNIETNMSATKSAVNTDNYYSYANIASRQLGAESSIIAHSGRGIAINYSGSTTNTVPAISVYGDVPTDTETYEEWDYTKDNPQVIVVFLGINDHWGKSKSGISNPATYITEKYTDFITSLREKHNDAHIILCSRTSNCSKDSIDATYNALSKNDSKLHRLVFDPCPSTGLSNHPTVAQHETIAAQLVAKINSIDNVWNETSVANKYELLDAKIVTENNAVTATVTAKKISANAGTTIKAFAAAYDKDNRLVEIKIFDINKSAIETPLTLPITSDVKSVKWFVWEGDNSPVAKIVESEL